MPAWPDILSKYNILLSQSHSISMALVAHQSSSGNPFEKIALHPGTGMTDMQFDTEVAPLLRTAQTVDVLQTENEIVRQLSEHMETRGMLGVLTQTGRTGDRAKRTEYEDVLRECEQIRAEHDQRVDRAVRAVAMLREKYDWKARVAVEMEEPEDFDWDTGMPEEHGPQDVLIPGAAEDLSEAGESADTAADAQSNDSEEEEELEEVLGNGRFHSPEGTPVDADVPTPMVE